MDDDAAGLFTVVRVVKVDAYSQRIDFVLPNGSGGWARNTSDHDFAAGDVLYVDFETWHMERAPDTSWPEPEWVGVVKHRTDEDTIVETGGRLVLIKTNDVKYAPDNTVLVRETAGVLRVLTDTPIRAIDLGLRDEPEVESRFRVT